MSNLSSLLKNNQYFMSLPDDLLGTVANVFQVRSLKAGEVIFKLGDPGDAMLLVMEGKIAIYLPEKDNPEAGQPFRIFQEGEILGEMALLDRGLRSTSARAETDSVVAALAADTFKELLTSRSDVMMSVIKGLNERLRYTTSFIDEVKNWVNHVASGNYESVKASTDFKDNSLSALAAEFARMASQVRKREEKLKREIAQLRIEIDEQKRKEDFSQITQSEYYVSLKEKLKLMREDAEDD
jgi:CRP-like cAMP-binding protein